MNLLSEKDHSETEISQNLNLPLNTVHYNIEQLKRTGLIESKEFKWSEKGKKIRYYKPVNKFIVITQKQKDFSSILKTIIPVTLIGAFISGVIYYTQNIFGSNFTMVLTKRATEKATEATSTGISQAAITEGITALVNKSEVVQDLIIATQPNYALYFFIGVILTSFLCLLINYWRYRK